ncbi:MAG: hypothetical protein QOE70_3735 [Chthoniobacter sp.]|nr:hypothetical protein [Chthoniobacter sp.]
MAAKVTLAGLRTDAASGALLKIMLKNKELINLAKGRPIGDPNLANEALGLSANYSQIFSGSANPDIRLVIYDPATNKILLEIGKITSGSVQIGNNFGNAFKHAMVAGGDFNAMGSITAGSLQTATTITGKGGPNGPIPKIATSVTGFVKFNPGPETMFILKGKISVSGEVLAIVP